MKPKATYRIQLNKEFNFDKLRAILPYLSDLGISHIYASPIFRARRGTTHGYDVTDSWKINEELGGRLGFEALSRDATRLGLEWIQDIVPNHIAYSTESTIISDVMLRGSLSKYRNFLDVDWNHPSARLRGKILAPFLEENYEKALKEGKIRLTYSKGFRVKYGELELPVKPTSYKKILERSREHQLTIVQNKKKLNLRLRRQQKSDQNIAEIKDSLNIYNNNLHLLNQLLSEQEYALSNWRTAFNQINYRRFFDQLDMICLRAEDRRVFAKTHELVLKLLKESKISGLRVDHIDGLYDPETYLEKLRNLAPNAYLIVEKILLGREILPSSWPVDGTTGYDFLNNLNGLFVASENEAAFDTVYERFGKTKTSFTELTYECKKRIVKELFAGDLKNLANLLSITLKKLGYRKRKNSQRIEEALVELFSFFPVYRTYFNEAKKTDTDLEYFETALDLARTRNRNIQSELTEIEAVLKERDRSKIALRFLMRIQQFTGPIMAKGIEDTACYIYNRLLSLNEVGSIPSQFGSSMSCFHSFISSRQAKWPMSMNSTSTHDTKRGEDTRARLNVLSEIPSELSLQINKWSRLNLKKKSVVSNAYAPSRNEEYYIYQTIIGSMPFHMSEVPDFRDRLKLHAIKAIREAKINSNWLSPKFPYEKAVTAFVSELLDQSNGKAFLGESMPFQKRIAFYGFLNSLSQTLIKIATPGVPDFYQGTELWDLNMVDPDNRRPVDFEKRERYLSEVKETKKGKIQSLLEDFQDGKVKLFEIFKALETRNKNVALFGEGAYIPLATEGVFKDHIVSFCRKKGNSYAIAIAPRLLTSTSKVQKIPLGDFWQDTIVYLPKGAPRAWSEIFTESIFISKNLGDIESLSVAEVLRAFPVSLLLSGEAAV